MSIAENIEKIRKELGEAITLVVVSKTRSIAEISEAYEAGIKDFGESRVQELVKKTPLLPADIRWHLIGHLQSNKVKLAVPHAFLIHSIDSIDLLKEINQEAQKTGKIVNCLLQFHIAKEPTKYGFIRDDIHETITLNSLEPYKNTNIIGVMGMATFTDDETLIHSEFQELMSIFNVLKEDLFKDNTRFKEISMGMSDDYSIALEEGSSIIRIGTAIFGSRPL